MNIFMADSVNSAALPSCPAYAAYVNGSYANFTTVKEKFRYCRVFGIDVLGTDSNAASILDYEPGDVQGLDTMFNWVQTRENFRPYTATVYVNRSELPEVDARLVGHRGLFWLATLDGTGLDLVGTMTPGGHTIVAVQYATVGSGDAAFDLSYALPSWAFGG